jgi:hypothetical protein
MLEYSARLLANAAAQARATGNNTRTAQKRPLSPVACSGLLGAVIGWGRQNGTPTGLLPHSHRIEHFLHIICKRFG